MVLQPGTVAVASIITGTIAIAWHSFDLVVFLLDLVLGAGLTWSRHEHHDSEYRHYMLNPKVPKLCKPKPSAPIVNPENRLVILVFFRTLRVEVVLKSWYPAAYVCKGAYMVGT